VHAGRAGIIVPAAYGDVWRAAWRLAALAMNCFEQRCEGVPILIAGSLLNRRLTGFPVGWKSSFLLRKKVLCEGILKLPDFFFKFAQTFVGCCRLRNNFRDVSIYCVVLFLRVGD
jgi:hypothetical protein